jgi:hypothetical protein
VGFFAAPAGARRRVRVGRIFAARAGDDFRRRRAQLVPQSPSRAAVAPPCRIGGGEAAAARAPRGCRALGKRVGAMLIDPGATMAMAVSASGGHGCLDRRALTVRDSTDRSTRSNMDLALPGVAARATRITSCFRTGSRVRHESRGLTRGSRRVPADFTGRTRIRPAT